MVRPCNENAQLDAGHAGDENANHNVQMSAVGVGKNSIPCRRATTPRERKSFTPSDACRAVEEARFQKEHGEPFVTRRSRSTIDFGYVEPQEGDDKFSRSLRPKFYKPTPSRTEGLDASVQCASPRAMTPVKRPMTPVKREKGVNAQATVTGPTVDMGYVSPAEGDGFSRALRASSDHSKPWRPSTTLASAPNLSPRRERKSTASDVSPSGAPRSSTPNRSKVLTVASANVKPATPVAGAPNFSPRRERIRSDMTVGSAPNLSPQRKRSPTVTSEASTAVTQTASNASPAKEVDVSTPVPTSAPQLSPTKESEPAANDAEAPTTVVSGLILDADGPPASVTPECEVPAPNTPPASSQPQVKAATPDSSHKNATNSNQPRQRPTSAKGRERAAATDCFGQVGGVGGLASLAPQRPASARGRERPATPERKVQERPISAKGRERPATPERKVQERPASAKGRERPTATNPSSPPGRLHQRPASAERKVKAASPPVPAPARVTPEVTESTDKAAPPRREIAAMQKHLARQGATSPRLQHSASAAPEYAPFQALPISKSVSAAKFFDTRERAALAKHLERAAAKTAAATAATAGAALQQKPQKPVDAGSLVKTMQDKRRMRQGEASSPDAAAASSPQLRAAQPAKAQRVPLAAR